MSEQAPIYNNGGKPNESRLEREVRLHINALTRGKLGFDIATWHLKRAIDLGMKPGDVIRINDVKFELIDNMKTLEDKGVAWRPARFARYELKEVKEPKAAKA